jgi:non-specific serine/threonine protein kinase
MGEVYKAEDTRLGCHVALRFLPKEFSIDRHVLERFDREARAAFTLNHSNICIIYDIDESGTRHFIAMECLDGQTLRHRILDKRLDTEEILELGIQIATGPEASYSKGIIHRDSKPANIFVTKRGYAKILGFGMAKPVEAKEKAESSTSKEATAERVAIPGTAVGRVAYMSPEQVRGEVLHSACLRRSPKK